AFGFPERVEQTDQRRPLAKVVVEIEQLKAVEARSSEICLDLLLVTGQLIASGSPGEVPVPGEEALRGKRIGEDSVVPRLHETGELPDDIVIRVGAPLADLVGDDGNIDAGQ